VNDKRQYFQILCQNFLYLVQDAEEYTYEFTSNSYCTKDIWYKRWELFVRQIELLSVELVEQLKGN